MNRSCVSQRAAVCASENPTPLETTRAFSTPRVLCENIIIIFPPTTIKPRQKRSVNKGWIISPKMSIYLFLFVFIILRSSVAFQPNICKLQSSQFVRHNFKSIFPCHSLKLQSRSSAFDIQRSCRYLIASKFSDARRILKKSILVIAPIVMTIFAFFFSPQVSRAAVKPQGWDLFGRVPHDDWLFSNWFLTDRHLLKRSIVESVAAELPYSIGMFNRSKRVDEVATLFKCIGIFGVILFFAGIFYRGILLRSLDFYKKKERERGFSMPLSAISKKAARKGKQIDGMDEGWVDMELDDDEETDENEIKKSKKDKKNDDDDDDD